MFRNRSALVCIVAALLTLTLATATGADSATSITWYVVSSGGGHASSAHYTMDFTVGQPATGLAYSANYRLGSGLWYVVGVPQVHETRIYLPVIQKH